MNPYLVGACVLGADYDASTVTIPQVSSPKGYTDSDTVRAVQQALKDKGYGSYLGTTGPNHDGVDGAMGSSTARAINALQKVSGVPQTGVIDYGVLKLLGVSSSAQRSTTIVTATNLAVDQADNVDTPADAKAAASSMMAAVAAAARDVPPDVKAKAQRAKAAADAAKTPEEARVAAEQVKSVALAVQATQVGWWGQPLWSGAPVKRWQGATAGGAVAAIATALVLLLRRRR